MVNFSKGKVFFFYPNCSDIKIVPNSLEHAYLCLLNNDLSSAKAIFSKIDNPRGIWGTILVSILEGYMEIFPTYFQIRNFLEIDLDFLLKNEKLDYIEQLLGALDIFADIHIWSDFLHDKILSFSKCFAIKKLYIDFTGFTFYNVS